MNILANIFNILMKNAIKIARWTSFVCVERADFYSKIIAAHCGLMSADDKNRALNENAVRSKSERSEWKPFCGGRPF